MPTLRNAKHEHFAHLIAKGMKASKAYIAVGYSSGGAAQSANRLLNIAEIDGRIEELREAIEAPSRERAIEKAAMDKAWVLQKLVQVHNLGVALEPVTSEDGSLTGEVKTANLAAANKALELIGKELGMFIDRKEIRTGPLDGLDHDQLKELNAILQEIPAGVAAGVAGRITH